MSRGKKKLRSEDMHAVGNKENHLKGALREETKQSIRINLVIVSVGKKMVGCCGTFGD